MKYPYTQEVELKKDFKDLKYTFIFEVTYLCDKKCPYCYNSKDRMIGASYFDKLRVFNEILNLKDKFQIIILGGEPSKFEGTIKFYHLFGKKYGEIPGYRFIIFSHGNADPNFYKQFRPYKNNNILFSWHEDQTDEDLFFRNMEILKNNGVRFGTCINIGLNKKDWEKKLKILERVKKMGGMTQIEPIFIKNKKYFFKEMREYFKEYFYKCVKYNNIKIQSEDKSEILKFDFNDYELLPQGIEGPKKCYNKQFLIDPFLNLSPECNFFPELKINLKNNPKKLYNYIRNQIISCNFNCLSKSNVFNKKELTEESFNKIKDIINENRIERSK